MRFIHTADWHLGKIVHGVHMTEDQRHALLQLIDIIEEEKPDALIIAGDLYDRAVPPTEAVELLNEILYTINVEMNVPVVAISGNHDSAERLSFGTSWYRQSQLYLEGRIQKDCTPVQINGVNFYSVPYAEPGLVRQLKEDDRIQSHDDAMRRITEDIEKTMDRSMANVFVGHAFVLGGSTSDSERALSVGGSGCVGSSLFDAFDYTALGHLHSPDALNHPKVCYSGSLLKYSFSEAKQKKSISIIDMDSDGSFEVRCRSIRPKRDMREIEGRMEELLDPAFYQNQQAEDYLKITLLDDGAVLDPMNRLRQVYPNVLHLERKWDLTDLKRKKGYSTVKDSGKSELDLFETFYQDMTEREFDASKRDAMKAIIDKVRKEAQLK